jgi:hypothetical protein
MDALSKNKSVQEVLRKLNNLKKRYTSGQQALAQKLKNVVTQRRIYGYTTFVRDSDVYSNVAAQQHATASIIHLTNLGYRGTGLEQMIMNYCAFNIIDGMRLSDIRKALRELEGDPDNEKVEEILAWVATSRNMREAMSSNSAGTVQTIGTGATYETKTKKHNAVLHNAVMMFAEDDGGYNNDDDEEDGNGFPPSGILVNDLDGLEPVNDGDVNGDDTFIIPDNGVIPKDDDTDKDGKEGDTALDELDDILDDLDEIDDDGKESDSDTLPDGSEEIIPVDEDTTNDDDDDPFVVNEGPKYREVLNIKINAQTTKPVSSRGKYLDVYKATSYSYTDKLVLLEQGQVKIAATLYPYVLDKVTGPETKTDYIRASAAALVKKLNSHHNFPDLAYILKDGFNRAIELLMSKQALRFSGKDERLLLLDNVHVRIHNTQVELIAKPSTWKELSAIVTKGDAMDIVNASRGKIVFEYLELPALRLAVENFMKDNDTFRALIANAKGIGPSTAQAELIMFRAGYVGEWDKFWALRFQGKMI